MDWSPLALLLAITIFGRTEVNGSIYRPTRIGAWNLKRLGTTKIRKPEVVAEIVKVMRRYDIILILEVTDSTLKVPVTLLEKLNSGIDDTYKLTISERLGRTSYKEQYAFYWRESLVSEVSTYQYNDINDVFQFEPFIVVFEGKFDNNLKKFGMAAIHTKPSDAVKEIDALVDVYNSFKTDTGIEDVIIIGDFNAGCTYVSGNDYNDIRLHTDSRFTWLVSDHVDTTVKTTTCPYDRIVIAGKNMLGATYTKTAMPYYFDEELGITDDELVDDISDHYPIEVSLRGGSTIDSSKVNPGTSISVAISVTPEDLWNISFSSLSVMMLSWTGTTATAAISYLENFSKHNSNILSSEGLAVLLYKYNNGGLTDSSLYGEEHNPSTHTITVHCSDKQGICTTTWSVSTLIN